MAKLTHARAAEMLRSAASALEHGRLRTFRTKVQKIASEFGISPVFLPQGETANERTKRITNYEPSLTRAFGRIVCECGRWQDECTQGKDGSTEHHNL